MKIKQDLIKQIGELVIDHSNGFIDPCSEYVDLKDVIDLIDTTKHETVEEWEARTGESYPEEAPVWYWEEDTRLDYENGEWLLEQWHIVEDVDGCIVANHHGKPEIEG